MGRYSDAATEQRRRSNYARWLDQATSIHGSKFSYSLSEHDYHTQKAPSVRIVCVEHGEFQTTPHSHIKQAGGGCRECGLKKRGTSKKQFHAKAFEKYFDENLSKSLELVTPYTGVKEKLSVRCRVHQSTTEISPDQLMHGAAGCPKCARQRSRLSQTLKPEDIFAEFVGKFPSHIAIVDVHFDGKQSKIEIKCERHGTHLVSKGYLSRSIYGCPSCGNEVVGYAGYRLETLVKGGEYGRDTWLGVIEVDVFGISALKVGVTTRSLPERYKWFLRKIYFSAKLREIDALILENEIHRKFHGQSDLRIMKAGMRSGRRWSGDTECYFFKTKASIIEFIQKRIKNMEKQRPDYWRALKDFEQPDYNIRSVSREKSTANKPRAVVCIETGETFASQSEAAREKGISQGNLAMVLTGKRRFAGGCRWIFSDDFDPENIPPIAPSNRGANARPILRLDTLEEFPTSVEAQRKTGVSASHITSVCRGKRRTAGGTRWAYLEDYRCGDIPTIEQDMTGGPVAIIRVEDNRVYPSMSAAAKDNGVSVSAMSKAIKSGKRLAGYKWSPIS